MTHRLAHSRSSAFDRREISKKFHCGAIAVVVVVVVGGEQEDTMYVVFITINTALQIARAVTRCARKAGLSIK
jgi:hypothetical protein